MGIMDMVTQAASQFGGGDKAQVAGGLMQEVEARGGVGAIFSAFQSNGLGGLVQQWAGGDTAPAQPEQVEQGLQGTGMIDSIANRTGASSGVVKSALAMLLPVVVHHFVSSGHATAEGEPTDNPAPASSSILSSILGRLG